MIVDTALNHLECDPATPPQGNLSSGSSQLDNGAFGIAHNLNITVHEPCCQVGCRTRENSPVCMASPSQSRGVRRIKEGGKQILHSALNRDVDPRSPRPSGRLVISPTPIRNPRSSSPYRRLEKKKKNPKKTPKKKEEEGERERMREEGKGKRRCFIPREHHHLCIASFAS
ncbi:hypothetical protein Agabi119p4_2389 [Agaricus bisporus var. burnettii]|uniref:Uncharacterized protein n=1 Tax=Agaricus bisporus var. burnettii TaxID=192524 RepID=A0A8H7F931_AGABI|nr:hypothetical protein Agabi119p4_2389 [Agaricus bisporus var. burnettii]